MTPAERATAEVLTFRRFWGDAWAWRRLEQVPLEVAQQRERDQAVQMHRIAQARVGSGRRAAST